jgi:glutathione peroxidase
MSLTLRQRLLKWVYPLFVFYKRNKGESKKLEAMEVKPAVSFYHLSLLLNNGTELPFENLKGKKVLIVNTASNCGYTNQYAELQGLYQDNKDRLIILGFPSNDFKEQEKGSDEEIARFCQVNFGVSFPLAKKSSVIKGIEQNKIFEWLTSKELNGWNEQQPSWNFSKYVINEKGYLTHYFDPAVSPLSLEVMKAING